MKMIQVNIYISCKQYSNYIYLYEKYMNIYNIKIFKFKIK